MKLIQKKKRTAEFMLRFDASGIVGINSILPELPSSAKRALAYYDEMCKEFLQTERPDREFYMQPTALCIYIDAEIHPDILQHQNIIQKSCDCYFWTGDRLAEWRQSFSRENEEEHNFIFLLYENNPFTMVIVSPDGFAVKAYVEDQLC